MCRRHHLLAAPSLLRKKAGVSAEGPSLPLLSPAPPSSSLPVSTSAISCNDQRNHHQSMSSDSFFEEEILHQWCVSEEMRESSTIPAEACDAGSIEPKLGSQHALLRTPHAGQERLPPPKITRLLKLI